MTLGTDFCSLRIRARGRMFSRQPSMPTLSPLSFTSSASARYWTRIEGSRRQETDLTPTVFWTVIEVTTPRPW